MNIIGPDISFYQDDPSTPQQIDFVRMRQSAEFVIIRAGQNLWPDPDFRYNWSEAKKVGLPRGSYWFYDSRANPKRQAELWVEGMGSDFGELPLFADFEEKYRGKYTGWQNWYDFLERLKTLVGDKEIGVYTAYYYWRDNAPSSMFQNSSLEYFHQYPLWIANYDIAEPYVPKPWGKNEWMFWQFSEIGDGKPYGVESNAIDLNYFNGDSTSFCKRFDVAPPPPPPPPPPIDIPPTDTAKRCQVTVMSLRIRKGPGMIYETLGYLQQGEIVEEVGATSDGSWLQVRREDGLTGWCFGEYLKQINDTNVPPSPQQWDDYWYRIATATLELREQPNENATVTGILQKDDVLPVISESTDDGWVQMRRVDGLVGWCRRNNLFYAGSAQPSFIQQKLFKGVTYFRQALIEPRKCVIHALTVNLREGNFQFFVTPGNDDGTFCTRTVSEFLAQNNLDIAINGDSFSYLDPTSTNAEAHCSSGDPVKPNGYTTSRGTVYVERGGPTVYISERNEIVFEKTKGKFYNAISGDRMVVTQGKRISNLATNIPHPRTAIGLGKDGRTLILMVVDGRQPNYSEGMTFPELANMLIKFGAYTGINMDGGGSSAMVVKGMDGQPCVLNSPIDQNIPGQERAVANHLGIFVKK